MNRVALLWPQEAPLTAFRMFRRWFAFAAMESNVKTERKHGIKYDPQDLGGPDQGNNNSIDEDVRPDID
jgi:hypothetical protein